MQKHQDLSQPGKEPLLNAGIFTSEHREPRKQEERALESKMQSSLKDSSHQESRLKSKVTFESLERRLAKLAIRAGIKYEELVEPRSVYEEPVTTPEDCNPEQVPSKRQQQIKVPQEQIGPDSVGNHADVKPLSNSQCSSEIWSCPKCTFHNELKYNNCQICLWCPVEESNNNAPLPQSFRDYPREDDDLWFKTIPSPPPFPKPKRYSTPQSCPLSRESSPPVTSRGYTISSDQFPVLEKESLGSSQYRSRKSTKELEFLRWQSDNEALNANFRKLVKRRLLSESPPPIDHEEEVKRKPRPFTLSDFMEPWERPPANEDERVTRAIRDERSYHRWRCETSIMPLWNYKNRPRSN